jgi:hypothetical protein
MEEAFKTSVSDIIGNKRNIENENLEKALLAS